MRYAMAAVGLVLGFAALLASCGGADICLGCDGNSTPSPQNLVTATGNINQIVGSAALVEDVRVIFCVGFDGPFLDCTNTFSTTVDTNGNFTRSRLPKGSLRVGFRLDPNDNGMFEPTEPWAELEDPNGFLTNLTGGQTANILDVTIDFDTNTATATQITVTTTPTPTPNPNPT
jgi:hypothetical protein